MGTPVTVHELTYALPRVRPDTMRQRDDVLAYLGPILGMHTVHVPDKDVVLLALRRWAADGGRFTEALLAAPAEERDMPVCRADAHHFPGGAQHVLRMWVIQGATNRMATGSKIETTSRLRIQKNWRSMRVRSSARVEWTSERRPWISVRRCWISSRTSARRA